MVWSLVPADDLRGAQKYYIFACGRYKVGRKGCDIIVQMDTAVSRIHAEVIVDKMVSQDPCFPSRKAPSSHVKLRDCSKYGTFVNKDLGSMAVRLRHDEEAKLGEGDMVTFGTGNATFRFCHVPFIIFIHSSVCRQVGASFQDSASYIGAAVTSKWSPKCTHVLVDKSSSVTMEIIKSVLAKQIVVLADWLKVLAGKNICTELPSFAPYLPSLNLEGNLVRIAEPQVRENCLKGYTFVLVSTHKYYKFGDKLLLLLETSGARHVDVDDLSDSKTSADRENNRTVLVVPDKTTSGFDHSRQFSTLSRITDVKLVAAALSGHLDSSDLELVSYDRNVPAVIIASSQSTDETIVADSDVEVDAATSARATASARPDAAGKSNVGDVEEDVKDCAVREAVHREASPEANPSPLGGADVVRVSKFDETDDARSDGVQHWDVVYRPDLVVRNSTAGAPLRSSMGAAAAAAAVNFKCFRKREIVSGNNFRDLIPFSKDPYKENDNGRESDFMRDERKRKKLEAIAEELFNSEKLRKRAAGGASLEAFLSRR